MSDDKTCSAEFHGTSHTLDAVWWELEAQETDGYAFVALRFGFAGLETELTFDIEAAEEFLIQFRDEIVRAKQKELEWETKTDPKSGIAEFGQETEWSATTLAAGETANVAVTPAVDGDVTNVDRYEITFECDPHSHSPYC